MSEAWRRLFGVALSLWRAPPFGSDGMLEVYELLQRGWTVRGRSLRPSHRMVAHSGFLCFARRIAEGELFEPEGEGFR